MHFAFIASLPILAAFHLAVAEPALAIEDPEFYDNFGVVGLFPAQPLSEIVVRVTFDYEWGSGPMYESDCKSVMHGSSMSFLEDGRFRIDFSAIPGGYHQSQAILACMYSTYVGDGTGAIDFHVESATDLRGEPALGKVSLCFTQWDDFNQSRTVRSHYLCGDGSRNESVNSADALMILRVASGLATCGLGRCDVDRSGSITATDALRTLRFSIGIAETMLCGGC